MKKKKKIKKNIKGLGFYLVFVLSCLFWWTLPSYGQTTSMEENTLLNIPDSSYVLKNKKIYRIENGKQKFKAHLKIYEYAIDSAEVIQYLDMLFKNKNDTLIIKRSKQYKYRFAGLYSQNTIYKAVYKNGPKVKFFEPEIIGPFVLHPWYVWIHPLLSLLSVCLLLFVCIRFKDTMFGGNLFVPWFLLVVITSFLFMALSQVLMTDVWDVPENIAEVLVTHSFVYSMIFLMVVWISYSLIRFFKGNFRKEKKKTQK